MSLNDSIIASFRDPVNRKNQCFFRIQMKGSQKSVYENAAECPALWAGMNAAISKTR
jgi:hypothetical protein